LHAVGFWLPKAEKQDILAELAEEIQSQIKEKEAETGKLLDEAAIEEIIKHCGDPLIVAERFLQPQPLICSTLFPIYLFVLKIVGFGYLVPWLLVWVCMMIFDPAYRAAHPGLGQISNLSSLWHIMVNSFFFITIGFALVDRFFMKKWLQKGWNPRKLPAVRDPNQIPRSDSIGEIVFGIIFIMFWISSLGRRTEFVFSELRISLSPNWIYLFWGLLIASLITVGFSTFNLLRPYWTQTKAVLHLFIDLPGTLLFCWLFKAHLLMGLESPELPIDKAQMIVNQINSALDRIFPIVVLVCAIIVGINVNRIIRIGRSSRLLRGGQIQISF
jgi:hypothetical protein